MWLASFWSNSLGSLSGNLFLLLLYSCSASEKVTGWWEHTSSIICSIQSSHCLSITHNGIPSSVSGSQSFHPLPFSSSYWQQFWSWLQPLLSLHTPPAHSDHSGWTHTVAVCHNTTQTHKFRPQLYCIMVGHTPSSVVAETESVPPHRCHNVVLSQIRIIIPNWTITAYVFFLSRSRLIWGNSYKSATTSRSYIVETPSGEIRRNRSQLNVQPSETSKHSTQSQQRSPIKTRSQTGNFISPPERLA